MPKVAWLEVEKPGCHPSLISFWSGLTLALVRSCLLNYFGARGPQDMTARLWGLLGVGGCLKALILLEKEGMQGKDCLVSYIEKDLLCKDKARMWILQIPAWNEFVYRILKVRSSWEVIEFSPPP